MWENKGNENGINNERCIPEKNSFGVKGATERENHSYFYEYSQKYYQSNLKGNIKEIEF